MYIYYIIVIIFCFSLAQPAFAEENQPIELEPVVVTASKIEEPISEVPASVEVITHQEISDKQAVTLDEALNAVSGLNLLTRGSADPGATIMIRGASYKHTVFMIDGIKINPPFDQIPEMGALLLSNLDRIEVIKGSYSALYGSEAAGGVINVITMDRPGTSYSLSGGTYKTFNGNLLYTGKSDDTSYTFGYERFSTDGFKYSGPYWNNTITGKINQPLSVLSSIQFSTYYWEWDKYDRALCCEEDSAGDYAFFIDEDAHASEKSWINSIQLSQTPLLSWDYQLKLALYNLDLNMDNPLDTPTTGRPLPIGWKTDIESIRDSIEMQHNIYLGERDILTAGIHYIWERIKYDSRSNVDIYGNIDPYDISLSEVQPTMLENRLIRAVYLQNLYKIKDSFSFTAGARFENSPGSYDELTPKAAVLFTNPDHQTTFRAAYAHGFRVPSLNELYNPFMGNQDLKPEKSVSIEAGLRQPLLNSHLFIDATIFKTDFKDLIDWSSDTTIFTLVNVGKAEIRGFETSIQWEITEGIKTEIEYTRLITRNLQTDEPLSYRPDYKWTFDIVYKPIKRLVLDINAIYVGDSFDPNLAGIIGFDGKPLTNTIPSYTVINMATSYNMLSKSTAFGPLDLFLKLNNIFDEEYANTADFRNYGFTFLAGIRSTY